MKVLQNTESLNELQTRLKIKFPELTKSDLLIKDNDEKSMLTLVAYRLRKSKEQMIEIVEEL